MSAADFYDALLSASSAFFVVTTKCNAERSTVHALSADTSLQQLQSSRRWRTSRSPVARRSFFAELCADSTSALR